MNLIIQVNAVVVVTVTYVNINFSFQTNVCDVCHNLLQKAMSFNQTIIFSIKHILKMTNLNEKIKSI